MGIRIPIHPYVAAKGRSAEEIKINKYKWDARIDYVRRFVDRAGSKCSSGYILDCSPQQAGVWMPRLTLFERQPHLRFNLLELLKKGPLLGSILVPDLAHIIPNKNAERSEFDDEALRLIVKHQIQIIPIKHGNESLEDAINRNDADAFFDRVIRYSIDNASYFTQRLERQFEARDRWKKKRLAERVSL